jgi:hypothetical protein
MGVCWIAFQTLINIGVSPGIPMTVSRCLVSYGGVPDHADGGIGVLLNVSRYSGSGILDGPIASAT